MDVTFFEIEPYFIKKILFRWETREDSFWKILGSLLVPIQNSNLGVETQLEPLGPILNSNLREEALLEQPCIKLLDYSRRKKDQGMENQPSTTQPNIRSECMYLGRDRYSNS